MRSMCSMFIFSCCLGSSSGKSGNSGGNGGTPKKPPGNGKEWWRDIYENPQQYLWLGIAASVGAGWLILSSGGYSREINWQEFRTNYLAKGEVSILIYITSLRIYLRSVIFCRLRKERGRKCFSCALLEGRGASPSALCANFKIPKLRTSLIQWFFYFKVEKLVVVNKSFVRVYLKGDPYNVS